MPSAPRLPRLGKDESDYHRAPAWFRRCASRGERLNFSALETLLLRKTARLA